MQARRGAIRARRAQADSVLLRPDLRRDCAETPTRLDKPMAPATPRPAPAGARPWMRSWSVWVALACSLEIRSQIHAAVKMRHLLRIPVERQRRPATQLADSTLGRLAPAGMVHRRVHIGIESILAGCDNVPRRRRHLFGQSYPDDGLDTLETVLPRYDEP